MKRAARTMDALAEAAHETIAVAGRDGTYRNLRTGDHRTPERASSWVVELALRAVSA